MTISDLLALDRKHLWHPYASKTSPPPVLPVTGASGSVIRLADGTELIDALSSWWCMAHGHNHPAIMAAVREQTEKFAQVMFAGFTHEPAAELAARLAAVLPPDLDQVFFADSGSVAVECAAKMAVQYQAAAGRRGRVRLAAVRGGYHGDTAGAMALSDPDGMHTMFREIMPHQHFLPRLELRFEDQWDEAAMAAVTAAVDECGRDLAGIIVEPVFQGANAMRFFHPGYLRGLRRICDERGLLLIFDEIATGFGRTGKFFAMEYAGVAPDIVCVGKALTGGAVTLAAAIASRQVAGTISAGSPGCFMHGPTFMANPLACAAGCASLKLFSSGQWQSQTAAIESQLKRELSPLREYPGVSDVRVLGAVGVVELTELPPVETVFRVVRNTGVWLRPFGRWLYTMPPFTVSPEELSRITGAMRILTETGSGR